jgi:hypothetical protein
MFNILVSTYRNEIHEEKLAWLAEFLVLAVITWNMVFSSFVIAVAD